MCRNSHYINLPYLQILGLTNSDLYIECSNTRVCESLAGNLDLEHAIKKVCLPIHLNISSHTLQTLKFNLVRECIGSPNLLKFNFGFNRSKYNFHFT